MKTKIKPFLTFLILMFSCTKANKEVDPIKVASTVNSNIQLPAGSITVDPDKTPVDNSIVVGGGGEMVPIVTGSQMTTGIPFNAPNGNVVGAGIRFGDTGPVNIIKIPAAQGVKNGTLQAPFSISASTCNNLKAICHQIKCYEYAYTSDGKLSKANIRDVVMNCGKCDEPSCKGLLTTPCNNNAPGTGSVNTGGSTSAANAECNFDIGLGSTKGFALIITSGANKGDIFVFYNLKIGNNNLVDPLNDPNGVNSIWGAVVKGTAIYYSKSGAVYYDGKSITASNMTFYDLASGKTITATSASGTCK